MAGLVEKRLGDPAAAAQLLARATAVSPRDYKSWLAVRQWHDIALDLSDCFVQLDNTFWNEKQEWWLDLICLVSEHVINLGRCWLSLGVLSGCADPPASGCAAVASVFPDLQPAA
jgi:hypothetical protein